MQRRGRLSRSEQKTIRAYDADALTAGELPATWIPKNFPKKVFITFDVDGFDPAVMPATGTPVPGGLDWWGAMQLIDEVAASRKIVGFDVLELAPIKKSILPRLHRRSARLRSYECFGEQLITAKFFSSYHAASKRAETSQFRYELILTNQAECLGVDRMQPLVLRFRAVMATLFPQ